MRLIVLTTETPHHAYFVREVARRHVLERVLIETGGVSAPYETRHAFEDTRDAREQAHWFDGHEASISDFAESETFTSLNGADAVARLRGLSADAIIVFGTRRLNPEVIATCPDGMINLHGGDPEHYRGLDTHLWAVWHGDFAGLITTLHRVNPELDDGDIVGRQSITLEPGMTLADLRRANTEVCLALSLAALRDFATDGRFDSQPQGGRGRYYSFMPAALKDVCCNRFARHVETLS